MLEREFDINIFGISGVSNIIIKNITAEIFKFGHFYFIITNDNKIKMSKFKNLRCNITITFF
jgi:hypothetical protein